MIANLDVLSSNQQQVAYSEGGGKRLGLDAALNT